MANKIFKRDYYLSQMMDASSHSKILVVTGLRKVGKSTLAKDLFLPEYQRNHGIAKECIIHENISAWRKEDRTLSRLQGILDRIKGGPRYLVCLDEIQMMEGDYQDYLKRIALNEDVVICLTGSNSRGLSSDIAKGFGDHAFPIPVYPLSYGEILSISPEYPFELYFNYGGLPDIVNLFNSNADDISRKNYLESVFKNTYIKDIYDRDKSLMKLGKGKVESTLAHFSSNLTTEISIKKTIQGIYEDFKKKQKRVMSKQDEADILAALTGLIDDYEESYLVYVFEEDKVNLADEKDNPFKEQRKLYIADQGLLHHLSSGSVKLRTNLLENLIYLELKHAGHESRGLDLSYEEGGTTINGQVDFAFTNEHGLNVYIQAVYDFTDANFDREINSLAALPDGRKLIVFRENHLISKTLPDNIRAVSIEDFCRNVGEMLQ